MKSFKEKLSDESGFTLIETVVGLALILMVLGIFTLYLLPLMLRIPQLNTALRAELAVEQLQNMSLRISNELSIPAWWPESYRENSKSQVKLHDIGYLYTTKQETRPDLLAIEIKENTISLSWQKTTFNYVFDQECSLELIENDQKQLIAIKIIIPAKPEPFTVSLPIRKLTVVKDDQ